MASAAIVLQSPQLVRNIAEYQHGIHADMRLHLSAKDPMRYLDTQPLWAQYIHEVFAPLHDAITAWYNEWGHARVVKLFACQPRMERRVIAHALWSGNLSVLSMLPVEMLRALPINLVDFAALQGDARVLQYLHDVVGRDVGTWWAMYYAAQCGHLQVVRYLYELSSDTNVQRAVEVAARNGHLEIVKFFHSHYAPNLENALLNAIWSHELAVAQFILDIVGKDNQGGPRAIISAAAHGNPGVAGSAWL